MSNILIATPELSDSVNIIPSSETQAGPGDHLRKKQPSHCWQSTDTTPHVDIDFGVERAVNFIGLLFTNATSFATARVKTAASQGGLSTPVDDLPMRHAMVLDGKPHFILWHPDGLTARWIRIEITDTTNPAGYILAGRIYASYAHQFARNYNYGAQPGYDDDTQITETDGGISIETEGVNRRVIDVTLNLSGEGERYVVDEILRRRGASKDVLLITDPDATENLHRRIYYGRLQRRRVAVQTAFNHDQLSLQLTDLASA